VKGEVPQRQTQAPKLPSSNCIPRGISESWRPHQRCRAQTDFATMAAAERNDQRNSNDYKRKVQGGQHRKSKRILDYRAVCIESGLNVFGGVLRLVCRMCQGAFTLYHEWVGAHARLSGKGGGSTLIPAHRGQVAHK
jgi:hypothetical protein